MSVRIAGFESGAVAAAKHLFTLVRDQRHFAREHINKFILRTVPMTLARPFSRRKSQQIHSELRESGSISQRLAFATSTRFIVWRGIAGADATRDGVEIEFLAHEGWAEGISGS